MKREVIKRNKKILEKGYFQKGITLIALIVTIIILLILAGITISAIRRGKWVIK